MLLKNSVALFKALFQNLLLKSATTRLLKNNAQGDESPRTRSPSLLSPGGGGDSGRRYVPARRSSGGEVRCRSGECSPHTKLYEPCSLLFAQSMIGFPHSECPATKSQSPRCGEGAVEKEPPRRACHCHCLPQGIVASSLAMGTSVSTSSGRHSEQTYPCLLYTL